jgi:hypothetical protein
VCKSLLFFTSCIYSSNILKGEVLRPALGPPTLGAGNIQNGGQWKLGRGGRICIRHTTRSLLPLVPYRQGRGGGYCAPPANERRGTIKAWLSHWSTALRLRDGGKCALGILSTHFPPRYHSCIADDKITSQFVFNAELEENSLKEVPFWTVF